MSTPAVDAVSATAAASSATSRSSSPALGAGSAAQTADRFLKLLVTQLQNQDPLNPMDNAQMTSQMAQISTVSGIEQLNKTIDGLSGQFLQMQALQGASLVGREVTVVGDRLVPDDDGVMHGTFELAAAAGNVDVEVFNAAGQKVQTLALGASDAGRQSFEWNGGAGHREAEFGFRVVAKTATGSDIAVMPLVVDRVDAVAGTATGLAVELRHAGIVSYSDIQSIH